MWNETVIKKEVETDLRKVFQHFLMQVLLNLIQEYNNGNYMSCKENPACKPKEILTLIVTYEQILRHQGFQNMSQKILMHITSDRQLSLSDKKHLYNKFIWMELEEILKDKSNNLLYSITDVDQGYPNPMILGEGKARLLIFDMDREAVDEWFRVQGKPVINITDDEV